MKKKLYNETIYRLLIIVIAIFSALFVGAILLLIAKTNPLKAYHIMFTEPLSGKFGLTEILVRAAPLMLVGLGIAIAFRSGIINIGGEGQILIGAIFGTFIALSFPDLPTYILLPFIFIASFIGGAIWGGIAGWMKAYLSVNEILSTIMLNYIAFQVYMFLIRGPMIDPKEVSYGTGVPQTALISKNAWLARIVPASRLHAGIIIAVVLAICVYIFLWKTTIGYKLRAAGAEAKAAKYIGVNVKNYLVLAMLLSGGFAGMAGAIEVCGVHHRGLESISAGYGFSGIVVALFGGLHPLGIIPASAVFGLLIVGADMMQRSVTVPASIILAIQGLIILAIVSSQIFFSNIAIKEKIMTKLKLMKQGDKDDS